MIAETKLRETETTSAESSCIGIESFLLLVCPTAKLAMSSSPANEGFKGPFARFLASA